LFIDEFEPIEILSQCGEEPVIYTTLAKWKSFMTLVFVNY